MRRRALALACAALCGCIDDPVPTADPAADQAADGPAPLDGAASLPDAAPSPPDARVPEDAAEPPPDAAPPPPDAAPPPEPPPPPIDPLACRLPPRDRLADPTANANQIAAALDASRRQSAMLFEALPEPIRRRLMVESLVLPVIDDQQPLCRRDCTPDGIDLWQRMISGVDALASELDGTAAFRGCLWNLALDLAEIQRGFIEAGCGREHGTTRLLDGLLVPGTSPLALLCASRNAHDACLVPYGDGAPLAEPGRCPACTITFGDATCAVPATDACAAAGECLCDALDIDDPEQCAWTVFGARGAITWAEACVASQSVAATLEAPFDGRGLPSAATAGCALVPAVLDDYLCAGPGGEDCVGCGAQVPSPTCGLDDPGCRVVIHCRQRVVVLTNACLEAGGVCAPGWAPVEACQDDRPCELSERCGVRVWCQPEG